MAQSIGEVRSMLEEVGFGVTEEFELGDLTEVKEDRIVLPVTSGVLFRIQKATSRTSKDGSIKSVSAEMRLVEGIDVPVKDAQGNFTGSVEKKYQNKPMFVDLQYWVDTAIRDSQRYTSKNKPYLVPLKQFLAALGYDLTSPPKLNDEFYAAIAGRELRGDIQLREVRLKNPVSQEWEGTGEYVNEIKKFRVSE